MPPKKLALYLLYNLFVTLSQGILPIAALFSTKLGLFVKGRKDVFRELSIQLDPTKKKIWMHVASLGEYEQGVPVLEALRIEYPDHQLVLTFFSPSGYEMRKNTPLAEVVVYLPLDSLRNAMRFVKTVQPSLAVFIKYEVWPNYMTALQAANIPSVLIAAIFRPSQIYFKWYGGLMRNSLLKFTEVLVQNKASQALLTEIGYTEVSITGDSRFDRVLSLSKAQKALPAHLDHILEAFKANKALFVGGSVWPEDLAVLGTALQEKKESLKMVLAPHKIEKSAIKSLLKSLPLSLQEQTVWLSETSPKEAAHASVLVLDSMGLLNQVYPKAALAYVGGGFKTGLHNTVEAAVYGIPLAIGPLYEKFQEAKDLVELGGIQVIHTQQDASQFLASALDKSFQAQTKRVQQAYVSAQIGASKKIMSHLAKYF